MLCLEKEYWFKLNYKKSVLFTYTFAYTRTIVLGRTVKIHNRFRQKSEKQSKNKVFKIDAFLGDKICVMYVKKNFKMIEILLQIDSTQFL